jgi:protein SCO1/2
MKRAAAAALLGGLVLLGLAAGALLPRAQKLAANAQPAAPGGIAIGGPFTLIDGHGKTTTDQNFRGRFMLVYFGYTHCPDACPTTLSDIAAALDKLPPPDRAKVTPIFITVDPERDTPKLMADYVAAFGPEFAGLTGSKAQIEAAEQSYHVYAQRHELAHGDYAMDHSSVLYVMGPTGNFLGIIGDDTKPADLAQRLKDFGA